MAPRHFSKPISSLSSQRNKLQLEELESRLTPVSSVTDLSGTTAVNMAKLLVGSLGTVSNVTFKGTTQMGGTFKGGNNSVGFDQGVILSSGRASDVIGASSSFFASTIQSQPGDADLTGIAVTSTYDAAVLEFDFISKGNSGTIFFTYAFGSEEYPEYVGSSYNDVFGIYLDGKRVNYIPGTTTPVSINNVNSFSNSTFYVDNSTSIRATTLDGLTTPITNVVTLSPGVSHHVKLAIADAGDGSLDSDVFIKAGSLAAPNFKVTNPLRYVYDAKTQTYSGQFILQNLDTFNVQGPLYISIVKPGMPITNAAGVTASGKTYFSIPNGMAAKSSVIIKVSFSNPNKLPMGTVFVNNAKSEIFNTLN